MRWNILGPVECACIAALACATAAASESRDAGSVSAPVVATDGGVNSTEVLEPTAIDGGAGESVLRAATLRGQVRAKGSREPIVGATIVEGDAQLALTTPDGLFEVTLPAGVHHLTVRGSGHRAEVFQEKLEPADSLEVVYRLEPLVRPRYETRIRGESPRSELSRVSLAGEEIREIPGTMGDPFRVIMMMPGVASIASGLAYPVVRGSQPAATGYFIDGVRIPSLFHLALGPAVVSPDFIERLDFFAGAPPVQYGRLLGGAVEATVAQPREDRLRVSAYVDLINAGAYVAYPIRSTGTSVVVSGRVSYTGLVASRVAGLLIPPDASGARSTPIADLYDYQARIEQRIGGGRLRLLALGSSDTVGLNSDSLLQTTGRLTSVFHRLDVRYRQSTTWGDVEAGVTGGFDDMGGRAYTGKVLTGEYTVSSWNVAGRLRWAKDVNDWLSVSAGADLEHRRGKTTVKMTALEETLPPVDASAYRQPTSTATLADVFAQAHLRLGPRWDVFAGLRADEYSLAPSYNSVALEPRVSARYRVADTVLLKAGVALVHQPPTVLIQLPVMDVAGLRFGLQQAVQTEVGVEWSVLPSLQIVADVYYNALTRAVEFDLGQVLQEQRRRDIPGRDVGTWGRSYGFELMIRRPLGERWFGWVSYSLQRSTRYRSFTRFDDSGEPVGTVSGELPFAFDQTHVLNGTVSYRFDNGWTIGAGIHFNTGRLESGQISSRTHVMWTDPTTGATQWRQAEIDRVARLPPFFRVDARVSKEWIMNDFRLEAYLDVMNVTLSQEVLAYDYRNAYFDPRFGAAVPTTRQAIGIPLIVPMLGVKGRY